MLRSHVSLVGVYLSFPVSSYRGTSVFRLHLHKYMHICHLYAGFPRYAKHGFYCHVFLHSLSSAPFQTKKSFSTIQALYHTESPKSICFMNHLYILYSTCLIQKIFKTLALYQCFISIL